MTERKTHRCVIYTRKSTEEGLDQEFNSLDAQAEACGAYIASQAGEGWNNTGQVYRDAGISGGHMERQGLQDLIIEIEAGHVDVIVVYKVDRLTRSLADFAKLVELFDEHNVSFVSVTQAFNTTNSMGRLTLNVLLSFAQFEREVTAERIRDKVAASKKRGQWMGGLPPMGYINQKKKLVVIPKEAKSIRRMFEIYDELGSVPLLKVKMDDEGIKTRMRTSRSGQLTGGKFFSRGHLYQLLANVIYVGKIKHKGNIYDGEHEAIIDEELWGRVQDKLKANAPKRVRKINVKSGSLLTGTLYDSTGDRLTPIHTKKSGRRYRYYVSNRLTKGELDDGKALRLPAENIEKQIQKCIGSLLSNTSKLADHVLPDEHDTGVYSELGKQTQQIQAGLLSQVPEQQREMILQLIKRIDIESGEIEITINTAMFNMGHDKEDTIIINYPYQLRRRGVETKLVISGQAVGEPDQGLIDVIAKARRWYEGFKVGKYLSIKDLAKKENMDRGDVSRILPLAFLAPAIIRDILQGKQPADLTLDVLQRSTPSLPMSWDEQKTYLGFA